MKMNRRRRTFIGTAVALLATIAVGVGMFVNAERAAEPLEPGPFRPAVVAPAQELSKAYAMVAAHVRPAVVSVYSERMVSVRQPQMPFPFGEDFFRDFFGDAFPGQPQQPGQTPPRQFQMPQRGMGSGMILDKQGRILTSYHVVREVDEIRVQLADKRSFEAEIVSSDPPSDIAVIRIKDPVPRDLPAVQLGDSNTLVVGDLVMAIGAPFGYVQTVTTGVLSAKGRSGVGINTYEDFLQTDAAINPGNSGGPLLNMRGQVIGMNTAIATSVGQFAGVGFATPVDMIKNLLPTLLKGGKITRGMLGVIIQEVTGELAKQFGVREGQGALVAQVNGDSPAARAGFEAGDVIVRYNGTAVQDTAHLRNMVAATKPGESVQVEVVRGGQNRTLNVRIGELAADTAGAAGPQGGGGGALNKLGLSVQTLTAELARQLRVENEKGVVVTDVRPGSPAASAGLQRGDLILEANRQRIATVSQLQQALGKPSGEGNVLLLIKRQNSSLFVVLPVPE